MRQIMGIILFVLLNVNVAAQTHQIRIIHTNDIGGLLVDKGSGQGLAARMTAVETLSKGLLHLVVDAGNSLGPDILSAWQGGRSVVDAFRNAGYDAMGMGHHDFDYGTDTLAVRNKQAGFPFLAANVKSTRPSDLLPFEPYLISKVGDVRIGLIGLLDEKIAFRMNPESASDLEVTDPVKSARATLSALSSYGVDLTVALLHADQSTSLSIARSLTGLDLLIVGGHTSRSPESTTTYYKLANGVHVLTTPISGAGVGYSDLTFTQSEGGLELSHVTSDLFYTETLSPDSAIVAQTDLVQKAYDSDSGKLLGKIDGITVERRATAVGNLMRLHTETEIGVVSRKTFQEVDVTDGFYQRDVNRLIRFDDVLVKLELTGRQLRDIVRRSKSMKSSEDALVFAGLDVENMVVNGRPIQNKEKYRIVTLRRLSQGESGYKPLVEALTAQNTGISLRSLTSAGLEAWGTLSSASFWEFNLKPVWRSTWSLEGSFNRNYIG
jgi:2',3'-cyclic-nucleotide 2'-phosphodiesterase (5'-nucleotidase family)